MGMAQSHVKLSLAVTGHPVFAPHLHTTVCRSCSAVGTIPRAWPGTRRLVFTVDLPLSADAQADARDAIAVLHVTGHRKGVAAVHATVVLPADHRVVAGSVRVTAAIRLDALRKHSQYRRTSVRFELQMRRRCAESAELMLGSPTDRRMWILVEGLTTTKANFIWRLTDAWRLQNKMRRQDVLALRADTPEHMAALRAKVAQLDKHAHISVTHAPHRINCVDLDTRRAMATPQAPRTDVKLKLGGLFPQGRVSGGHVAAETAASTKRKRGAPDAQAGDKRSRQRTNKGRQPSCAATLSLQRVTKMREAARTRAAAAEMAAARARETRAAAAQAADAVKVAAAEMARTEAAEAAAAEAAKAASKAVAEAASRAEAKAAAEAEASAEASAEAAASKAEASKAVVSVRPCPPLLAASPPRLPWSCLRDPPPPPPPIPMLPLDAMRPDPSLCDRRDLMLFPELCGHEHDDGRGWQAPRALGAGEGAVDVVDARVRDVFTGQHQPAGGDLCMLSVAAVAELCA